MGKAAVKACRCGLKMAAQANGIWTCSHCDQPCEHAGPILGCPRCSQQLKAVIP